VCSEDCDVGGAAFAKGGAKIQIPQAGSANWVGDMVFAYEASESVQAQRFRL